VGAGVPFTANGTGPRSVAATWIAEAAWTRGCLTQPRILRQGAKLTGMACSNQDGRLVWLSRLVSAVKGFLYPHRADVVSTASMTGEDDSSADSDSSPSRLPLSDVRGKIHCGIISIRPDEFDAVLKFLRATSRTRGSRWYSLSSVDLLGGGKCRVAMMRCTEQGGVQLKTPRATSLRI
jgi:hypothetical protein